MPHPLPEPLYIPEHQVPLPPIDLDAFPSGKRAKIKAKQQLKLRDLKPIDNVVVSSAISQFGALLVAVCGFPNADTAWLLACNANHWASKKHGRHLKLTKGLEYLKLLYDCIPQMQASFVGPKAATNVALAYKLEMASSKAEIKANSNKVKLLLTDANFTLMSLDSCGGMVAHNNLFNIISLPCMALTAAVVEKVLRSYKSGTQVDNKFNTNNFMPVYFLHLATLAAIHNLDKAQNQLIDHLQEMANELQKPYQDLIQLQTMQHICPLVPQALIAARYRATAAPKTTSSTAVGPSKRHSKNPPPTLTQELVYRVQMQLGVPHAVLVSSTPKLEVVNAIYDASQANRKVNLENLSGLLAQVAGSSNSKVQAMQAGALEPHTTAGSTILNPTNCNSSDKDANLANSVATGQWDVRGGQTKGAPAGREPTLSGNESEDSGNKTNGNGAAGLVDVTMKTAGGASKSNESDKSNKSNKEKEIDGDKKTGKKKQDKEDKEDKSTEDKEDKSTEDNGGK
ncbi:hypothetical protein RHS03_07873, partial [Rhizoctonia solani]